MTKKKKLNNQMDVIPLVDEIAKTQEYLEAVEDVPAKGKRSISASFGQCSNLGHDFQRKKRYC